MKRLCTLLSFLLPVLSAGAQTTEEWLQQKETAIRYLTEQILALKGYAHLLEEGYEVVQKGLGFIGDLKAGDFRQHKNHLEGRFEVNPNLVQYSGLRQCLVLYAYIQTAAPALVQEVKAAPTLMEGEKVYIRQVLVALLKDSVTDLEELKKIVQKEHYEMWDDERLAQINGIHNDLHQKRALLQSMRGQVSLLMAARAQEQKAFKRVKKLTVKE